MRVRKYSGRLDLESMINNMCLNNTKFGFMYLEGDQDSQNREAEEFFRSLPSQAVSGCIINISS